MIPTLNEEKNIGKVLDSIPKELIARLGYETEIIIVDGNSIDRTRDIAKKRGARVIIEPRRGYGRAYLTGFKYASGEIMVTGDGDGTYPFEIIPLLIQIMKNYNIDFITTNRFNRYERQAWTPVNFVGNKLLTLLHFILFGLRLKDSQSGMWCFKRSLLKYMKLSSWGMEFSSEIKIEGFKCAKKALELPIIYRRRLYGRKKLRWFRDGIKIFLFLIKKRILDFIR